MVLHEESEIGEKLPGTYCPLCGEVGLRKMVFDGAVWAVCPMVDGKPVVTKLEQAHTGYVLASADAPAKAPVTPAVEAPTAPKESKFKASPPGDSNNEEIDNV